MHNAAVAKRHKKRPEMSTQEKQKRTKLNYKNRTECNFTLEIMAENLMIVSASISLIIFTFFQCCTSLINSLSLHFIKFNQNAKFLFSFCDIYHFDQINTMHTHYSIEHDVNALFKGKIRLSFLLLFSQNCQNYVKQSMKLLTIVSFSNDNRKG